MSSVAASPSDPAHRWALVADLFERAQSLDAAGRERAIAQALAAGERATHVVEQLLTLARLESGETEVWDTLTRQFESGLIHAALELTRGRRIEAAQRLGIGRNTITRKIQELGLED